MRRRKHLDFSGVAEPVKIGATAREILHKTVDDGVSDLDMAKRIRLDRIEPDPDQPRKNFDEESLRDLARSILVQGVLQPIVVEWMAERESFRIISGERRWRAMHLAVEMQSHESDVALQQRDLSRIPAIIQNPGALDRYVQQVYENEQRQDYSDVERAFAYERLKDALGLTWDDLAERFGLSKGRIHQIRRTKNRLVPAVQHDITQGHLTGTHGLHLATLPPRAQEAVADKVREHHLSAQQTQAVVQKVRDAIEAPAPADGDTMAPRRKEASRTKAPDAASPEQAAAGATEKTSVGHGATRAGEGVIDYTLATALAEALAIATAAKPKIERAQEAALDRYLGLIRRLIRLPVPFPQSASSRAKLARGLDELITWAQAQRARLSAD